MQVVDRLALAERVDERREGADVHGHRADRDEVAGDAAQLAGDGAEALGPRRHLELEQLLDRHRVALVGEHRRHVVDAVGVGHEARVADQLADLLDRAVQVADVGDGLADHLAVGLDDEVDDAVGGGVLRPEVEDHLLAVAWVTRLRMSFSIAVSRSGLGAARRVPAGRKGWEGRPERRLVRRRRVLGPVPSRRAAAARPADSRRTFEMPW